ncbi:MAG: SMP-30/gluconolactonase/LRE family protein [Solirubrobacteraceae bacterium]
MSAKPWRLGALAMTPAQPTTVELTDLVDLDRGLEEIVRGFTYTEGPVWEGRRARLLFHDLPSDTRYCWSPEDGMTVDAHPTHKSNGMALDPQGRVLVCESGINRLVRWEDDGSVTVLASHYEGKELNSPNDIGVHPNGDIYFSDPAYGRIPVYGEDRPQQLDFQGVYRVRASDGELELIATDCEQPNGICWSPDGNRLYVDDCEHGSIWVYERDGDGKIGPGRILRADAGVPCPWEDAKVDNLPSGYVDGMRCDAKGNIYVTSKGGILVMDSDGNDIGLIDLPEDVANFTWGGADGLDLFICCRGFLGRVRMKVHGAAPGGDVR